MASTGITNFVGERLKQAREARGINQVTLSELIGASKATMSNYEGNRQKPPFDVVSKLVRILRVPEQFFIAQMPQASDGRIFYRSMSYATKASRVRAERKFEWLQEVASYVERFLQLPTASLPDIEPPSDFKKIDEDFIESAATAARKSWEIGDRPCPNLVRLGESKGIITARCELGSTGLDAFSQLSGGRPFIFLSSDKASACRSRFDFAHELGHLVLHKFVKQSNISLPADHKLLERQAHRFASAFLLPSSKFLEDFDSPTLDDFRMIKAKWKVAIAAMIMRCSDLGIIDESQSVRMWKNMRMRRWREREPLDDELAVENPSMMSRCITMMIEDGFATKEQLLAEIGLGAYDVEQLCGLPSGYFENQMDEKAPEVSFRAESKIVNLF
jgi:Zn-dependent peptidase ImmA (M78 family)/transcriptional regulator with XRE-family HTH domain